METATLTDSFLPSAADPSDGIAKRAAWKEFGLEPITLDTTTNCAGLAPEGHDLGCKLPVGLIGFTGLRTDAADMGDVLQDSPIAGALSLTVGERNFFYFHCAQQSAAFDSATLPATVRLLRAGDIVPLPAMPSNLRVKSVGEIATFTFGAEQPAPGPALGPEITNSPLAVYSLRGSAAEFERLATETKPLLGDLCLSGQATMWFAPPNAGKTLITLKLVVDAVANGSINPANIYYINADDSSSGFADKMHIMDDLGAHTLAPGYNNLRAENLISVLADVATQDKARGSLIILDTVKKFASLMDKTKASAFAHACRQVVMRGGTILGLAHTTKNPNANGTMRYAGTSDMVDDFDAAYTVTPLAAGGGTVERVVRFDAIKRRGNNVERIAYAYASDGSISYAERLASVRTVDPDQLDQFQRIEAERSDADVVAVVGACITDGIVSKMALAKAAATRAKISERAAIRLIETYTGDDPAQHRWAYSIKERGAKVFTLHPEAAGEGVKGEAAMAA